GPGHPVFPREGRRPRPRARALGAVPRGEDPAGHPARADPGEGQGRGEQLSSSGGEGPRSRPRGDCLVRRRRRGRGHRGPRQDVRARGAVASRVVLGPRRRFRPALRGPGRRGGTALSRALRAAATTVVTCGALVLPASRAAGGPAPANGPVKWERQFDEALKKTKAAGKPVLVDFWADWC